MTHDDGSMLRLFALLFLLLAPLPAVAEPASSCTAVFVGGQAPRLLNPRLAERTHLLCYRGYAVLASGVTRGALWSAEHLTAVAVTSARTTPRVDVFHPDDNYLWPTARSWTTTAGPASTAAT